MWEELCINGYLFDTPDAYNEAKKEEEAVKYIKQKTNLKDYDNALKMYNTLLEKKTLHTIIGLDFLYDLRRYLVSKNNDTAIQPIPVSDIKKSFITKKEDSNYVSGTDNKDRKVIELYRTRNRNLKVIIFFLVILIVALFTITFTGENSPLIDEEMKLQDKYASWEEDLTLREQKLKEQIDQDK